MRALPGRLADLLNGPVVGPFVGANAPSSRVTVVPNWHLNPTTGNVGAWPANKRPVRTFSDFAIGLPGFGVSDEVEIFNLRSVVIDRTLDQDAATMTLTQYNIQMDADTEVGSMPASLGYQLGEPGFYSWTRGQSAEGVARWSQHPNEWQNVLNPNAMLKVYQGYGGKDLPLQDALDGGYVILTGVFLVDTVTLDAAGVATFTCRDMAKLLIEQMVYPPIIPIPAPYPLEYNLNNQGPGGSTSAPAGGIAGNYTDYTDIVRDLLLWAGWFFFDSSQLTSTRMPQVYGSIQTTGVYDTAGMIGADVFDKKPIIDVIKLVRDIVGFIFYIDEIGAAHFEPPNWWSSGNFNSSWSHGDGISTFLSWDAPVRTPVIPAMDERVNLSGYSMAASDAALRSEIIVALSDPAAVVGPDNHATVLIPPNVGASGDPLRGMQKPFMTPVPYEVDALQRLIYAQLIALQIGMSQRAGSVTAVLNPAITLDTQVQIYERTTGEAYIHYVRGIHTEHDLDSGKATMTLTTQWLGSASKWAIAVTPGAALPISTVLATFLSTVGSPKTDVYLNYAPPTGTGPGAPGTPGSVSAMAGDGSATVGWVHPVGGGTTTSYVVTPYVAGVAGTPVTTSGSSTSAFVSGLTNGLSYTFVVTAVNSVGRTSSLPSNAVIPTTAPVFGSVAKLISDMVDSNLVIGAGIPVGYSFYGGPEFDTPTPNGMTATTAWGVIWQNAATPSTSVNTRVEVSGQELWLWSTTAGTWSRYQDSLGIGPTGGHYYQPNPDGSPFNNGSIPAQMRDEAFGGTSDLMQAGFWFHFWPAGGRPFLSNPGDIDGAASWFRARLILDDPNGVDDRANCHLVASCGADWWQTPTAPWPQNAQVYYARFLPIPTDGSWVWLSGNSWTSSPTWSGAGGDSGARITANPPPFPG